MSPNTIICPYGSAAIVHAAALIRAGHPVAVPTETVYGLAAVISPTCVAHVMRTLAGRIAMVIDDGPCPVGIESTVTAANPDGLRLLRSKPAFAAKRVASKGGWIKAPIS